MADAQRDSERKGVTNFKAGTDAVGAAEEEQVMVTINTGMGRIVRVEKVDKAGKRQEFAEEDWAKLVGDDEVEEIESALEEAFEAGVAGVLGEEYSADEYEDDEEKAIRRMLIGGLLRRPIRRRILQRLLLSSLLRRSSSKAGFSGRSKNLSPQKGS